MSKMITVIAGLTIAGTAMAQTITTSTVSNPYADYLITFDEPGVPLNPVQMSPNHYQSSHGIVITPSDGATGLVDDWSVSNGFQIGTGNSHYGNFGHILTWDYDITGLELDISDPSGPGGPFGGYAIYVYNDGAFVGSGGITPAWGGAGDNWVTIAGVAFDEVRLSSAGFPASNYIDNLTWTPVPGSLALLGLGGIAVGRRRR